MNRLILILIAISAITSSCNPPKAKEILPKTPNRKVIYGKDNRVDFNQIPSLFWFDLAQSTVALVRNQNIEKKGKKILLKAKSYGHNNHLCEDEPFYDQPQVSFCSGFLVGSNTIITAGHCMRSVENCENTRFVFGYSYNEENSNPLEVPKDNVYGCSKIVESVTNALTGIDFAIIKTDRPVKKFNPLYLRTQDQVNNDEPVTVIGYPSGLPGKYADGGVVRSTEEEGYFVTSLDTYGGNSGSAVFNSDTGLVEGILVRGDTDYVYDHGEKCRRSNVCGDEDCRGEDVVRISVIFDYLTPQDLQ